MELRLSLVADMLAFCSLENRDSLFVTAKEDELMTLKEWLFVSVSHTVTAVKNSHRRMRSGTVLVRNRQSHWVF